LPEQRRYADEALALAEELADPHLLGHALSTAAEVTFLRTGRTRRDLVDRAMELERSVGGRLGFGAGPRSTLAWLLARSDRHVEARILLRDLIADAAERAAPVLVWHTYRLAQLELATGAWEEAARLCTEAMSLGRQVGRGTAESRGLMILAELDAFRGEAAKARREIPALLRIAELDGTGRAVHGLYRSLALLELSCGNPEASWQQVAPLFAGLAELDEHLARLAGSVAIEALIAAGDLHSAERLLGLLDDHAAESESALLPLAGRCRGVLEAARGNYEPAIAALEAAVADPDPPHGVNPFELGRTLLALGTVQRKARHKRAARESLERAAEIFGQLGARIWLENARSELARIGGRVAHEGELSETERRIVELVVAGRRNREVADELSLSPNTVAWNLSKVYRKLGVTSRTELAAQIAATPPA
jgi:DNA-binding CsgD family transcriptional regulator